MNRSLLRLDLAQDRDIVAARQRARQVSALLNFDSQDQVRIATAVSELARNAIRHAGFDVRSIPATPERLMSAARLKPSAEAGSAIPS